MRKVDNTHDNEMICMRFCGACPSYPGVQGEILFCSRGKSSAPKGKSGCRCGTCDIWNKYDLSGFYYCSEDDPG